jgi:hypothetical protein
MFWGENFYDCSDEDYACVATPVDFFAVPRSALREELREGQRYSVDHTNFLVEYCYGSASQCEKALISAECASAQVCECRHGKGVLRKSYFSYSATQGILSFYILELRPGEILNPLSMLQSAFSLVGAEGFLKKNIPLPRANLPSHCI